MQFNCIIYYSVTNIGFDHLTPSQCAFLLSCLFSYVFLQMFLVVQNVTLPFGDGSMFANPNFVSNLEESGKRDQYYLVYSM